MKRILVILGFFLIVGLLLPFSGDNKIYAVSGCCKERSSYKAKWYQNGRNFGQCKALNQNKDGDNVFDRRGLVWWDSQCR